MEGKISFSGSAAGPTDPLCTELTAYIKVSEPVWRLILACNETSHDSV